jgi:hypothetical protein
MRRDHEFDQRKPHAPHQAGENAVKPARTATKGIDLTEENPYVAIWTRPRATIRGIVDADPTYRVVPLAILEGIAASVKWASDLKAGESMSLPKVLALVILLGPVVGLAALYLAAWLLRMTGGAAGKAKPAEIRAATAWSAVPSLATLPIWIIMIVYFGRALFTAEVQNLYGSLKLVLAHLATGLLELVLSIWTLVVLLKCLSEIQGFSAWKALASTLLSLLVVAVPFTVLVLLFYFFR